MESAALREKAGKRLVWALSLAMFCTVAIAACSGESNAKVEPTASPATTTAPTAADTGPVEAVPTSTSVRPITTSTTRPPSVDDEATVRQVYANFLTMIAVVGDPPNPDHPMIDATTTGALQARVRESISKRRDAGRRSTGTYRSSIVSVQVRGDAATVLDCSLDESIGFNPETKERGVADTSWYLRASTIVKTESGWRVTEFIKGDPCTPAS